MYVYTYIYIYIYMLSRIVKDTTTFGDGIVWAQTGHSTSTCTVSLHVIEPQTHQKFESFIKR